MKLLLIESTVGDGTAIGAHLAAAGHDVLSCTDEHGGPCRGIDRHADCPLEQHIDLAIVARDPAAAHTLAEMGSVCATRHRVPMLELDAHQVGDELPNVSAASALAKRTTELGYIAAVRDELSHLAAIVEVERTPQRIHVSVQVPARYDSPQKISAIADRARHAVRQHDPYVSSIDVSVGCYPDPG